MKKLSLVSVESIHLKSYLICEDNQREFLISKKWFWFLEIEANFKYKCNLRRVIVIETIYQIIRELSQFLVIVSSC